MMLNECPNCGNLLAADKRKCDCGYRFPVDGRDVPSPAASRAVSRQERARGTGSTGKNTSPGPSTSSTLMRIAKRRLKSLREVKEREDSRADSSAGAVSSRSHSLLMGCPACGARISRRATECPKCHKRPWAECKVCGIRIAAHSPRCPECGDPDPFRV